jgi:hypothetical protein
MRDCEEPIVADYGQFFALPGPTGKTTQVYRWVWPSRADKIWEAPGWEGCGNAHLSEDGEYLVIGDGRGGHIDRDYEWDQVMLRFYHRDTLIRAVPLREVLSDPKKVSFADCNSVWAISMSFIGAHRFALDTADDRRLIYDVTTGALTEATSSNAYNEVYTRRAEDPNDATPSAPPPKTRPPEKRAWPMVDTEHPVWSRNRRFFAVPAADRTVTQVFRVLGRGRSEKVWEKVGWEDGTFISDDGEYLVVGYAGKSVLDRKYTFETVMLTFYRRGTLIRTSRLRGIISLGKSLWEWPEGYEWGDYVGFVSAHRFAVDTVENVRVFYDVTKGVAVDGDGSPVRRFWTGKSI